MRPEDKINGNEVRKGNVLNMDNNLWLVTDTTHTQPGKGGAYIQLKMKGLLSPVRNDKRIRSTETVTKINLDEGEYQYLYKDAGKLFLINSRNPEEGEYEISQDLLGEKIAYLQDGMSITIVFYNGNPIIARVPDNVTVEIEWTEHTMKGQTASASYKKARLVNGIEIKVPPHVKSGDRVIIYTPEDTYKSKAE